jgi:hypothetical protein
MFGRSSQSKDFFVALIATAVAVSGFVFYAKLRPSSDGDANADLTPPARNSAPVPSAATANAAPAAIAAVYECAAPQGRVFSDRPCGADAEIRTVQAPNGMLAQPVPESRRSPSRPGSRRYAVTSNRHEVVAPSTKSQCAAIEAEIDSINARMRRGYRDGEPFRERLRELSEARWDLRCRFNTD